MTMNALVNACNQKSNRDPVVTYDDDTVERALESLRAKDLIYSLSGSGHRVEKYSHRLSEGYNLGRRESALLCVLMLRGPQTPGELRGRSERMHDFADLDEVESCLRTLAERTPDPLVVRLPRQPGTKEYRFAHLLSGEVAAGAEQADSPEPPQSDRFASLEAEIAELRDEVRSLAGQFAQFRKQFE